MKIVTIIENNPITGVRYGTIEVKEYNNNIQRRLDSYCRSRKQVRYASVRAANTKRK